MSSRRVWAPSRWRWIDVLRALALLALLAAWPASATTIFKDGFDSMSQVTVSLHLTNPIAQSAISPYGFVFDPVEIPPNAVALVGATGNYTINLADTSSGPPDSTVYTLEGKIEVRSVLADAGVGPGVLIGFGDTNVDGDTNITFDLGLGSTSVDILRSTKIVAIVSVEEIVPLPPPSYEGRIVDITLSFVFAVLPDYRMIGSSTSTANRVDRINIAPRLGGMQGTSSVNVIVNLGGGRRETSFRAQSGSVLTIPRAAPSMRGFAPSGTIMLNGLRRRHQVSFSASSSTTFTLPAVARIGASIAAVCSSSATADVRALRRLAASFAGDSSATGSTTKVARVAALAESGTVLTNGLSAAQQFLVSFTAESGSNMAQGLNILAPFSVAGSSSALGATANLYQGPADFNVSATEGWSVTVNAADWSVWV